MNTLKKTALILIFIGIACYAQPEDKASSTTKPFYFDIKDLSASPIAAPIVQPWRTIDLKDDYCGQWVVAGDLDGDGEIEIVSAKNVTTGDKPETDYHYTSAICAKKLDGSILWQWGNPEIGRKSYHHDLACQIYDWNGDGRNEVVIASEKSLIIFDGKTGKIIKDYLLPHTATDCIIACNLTGGTKPMDFILKDRYLQIWGMDSTGRILWKTDEKPYGYHVGHRPLPVDIDGDGKDEIFCGFFMLNSDGSLRWKISGNRNEPHRYLHMDSQVIVRKGKTPEEWLFAFTYCVGNGVGIVNGLGEIQKEALGFHYESIDAGSVFPAIATPQFVIDVDHTAPSEAIVVVLDANLELLGRLNIDYGRYHALVDWDGDGYDDIIMGDNKAIYNYKGEKICTFQMDGPGRLLQTADIDGDKVKDLLLVNKNIDKVYIFKNSQGKPSEDCELGTGKNFTLY